MQPVKILIPLSGGKDSQACLKKATETHPPEHIRALFCDTKWEHPITYQHIDKIRSLYGPIQVDVVNAGSVPEQILKHQQFPLGGARFCTEELKIWPTKRYCKALAEAQGEGFQVWYGMRTGEGKERRARYADKIDTELYLPHEVLGKYPKYLGKLGVRFRLPIVDWSTAEVMDYLQGHHNPLYDEGFDRVGCFPCQAAGDATIERAYRFDDLGRARRVIIMALADQIDKSPFSSKGGQERNPHRGTQCALVCGD